MTDLAIDARDLTRTFGSFMAVDHITFNVQVGEVFGPMDEMRAEMAAADA